MLILVAMRTPLCHMQQNTSVPYSSPSEIRGHKAGSLLVLGQGKWHIAGIGFGVIGNLEHEECAGGIRSFDAFCGIFETAL